MGLSLVDRFICRREGHKPVMEITVSNPAIESYITSCQRCGRAVMVKRWWDAKDQCFHLSVSADD